jgi:hypothetical protein
VLKYLLISKINNITLIGYFNFYHKNRYYLNEMVIHDVQMFKDFAILVGFDAHKIIYHSIFSGKFIEIIFLKDLLTRKLKFINISKKISLSE